MKLIIESGKIKRQIDGPYNVYGSREDLQLLADAIKHSLADNFAYGWVRVHPVQPSIADTPPEPWG